MLNKKIFVLLSVLFLVASCGNETQKQVNVSNSGNEESNNISELGNKEKEEVIVLSESEKNGLILMREEEKLARDVYAYFYKKYKKNIFDNINDSEEKHKSAILPLLEKFGIEDPIKNDKLGSFTSKEMSKLYKNLTSTGDTSLVEALKVGVTIEELDIKDLKELISNSKNEDIIRVYENLLKGSYSHLRAFMKNIDNEGENHIPQSIDKGTLDQIVNGKL